MNALQSALAAVFLMVLANALPAQTFSSGSTGADGAYNPTVSGDFDPAALHINAAGDNVFNFTTINIPSGVTIRLRASKVRNAPVIWLSTGDVIINGNIDISGDNGYDVDGNSPTPSNRRPAEPGAGGYYGGLGSHDGVGPESGGGPGGGPAGLFSGGPPYVCGGGNGSSYTTGLNSNPNYSNGAGPTYGNSYPVPLYGGSGGGGGWDNGNVNTLGSGGGAGGGAIRIMSTTQIVLAGYIDAHGGYFGGAPGCPGGVGAGGVVNLIAPTISGAGTIYIYHATQWGGTNGSNGLVRLGVTNYNFTGTVYPNLHYSNPSTSGNVLIGPLYNPPSNSAFAPPSLTITQVNGTAVQQPPGGNYLAPDVQINANTPVTVNVSAKNVPVGTIPILRVTAQSAGDQLVNCSPLAGTAASSTSTCSATFPFAVSIAEVRTSF